MCFIIAEPSLLCSILDVVSCKIRCLVIYGELHFLVMVHCGKRKATHLKSSGHSSQGSGLALEFWEGSCQGSVRVCSMSFMLVRKKKHLLVVAPLKDKEVKDKKGEFFQTLELVSRDLKLFLQNGC